MIWCRCERPVSWIEADVIIMKKKKKKTFHNQETLLLVRASADLQILNLLEGEKRPFIKHPDFFFGLQKGWSLF